MEQAAQGSACGTKQLEFKDCLDSAPRHRVWIWACSAWSQELCLILAVPSNSMYTMILCLLIDDKIDDVSVYDS